MSIPRDLTQTLPAPYTPTVDGEANFINDLTKALPANSKDCLIAIVKDKEGNVKEVHIDKGNWFSRTVRKIGLLLKYGNDRVQTGSKNLLINLTPHMSDLAKQLENDVGITKNSPPPNNFEHNREKLNETLSNLNKIHNLFPHAKNPKFETERSHLKTIKNAYDAAGLIGTIQTTCLNEKGEVKDGSENTYLRAGLEILRYNFDESTPLPKEKREKLLAAIANLNIADTIKDLVLDIKIEKDDSKFQENTSPLISKLKTDLTYSDSMKDLLASDNDIINFSKALKNLPKTTVDAFSSRISKELERVIETEKENIQKAKMLPAPTDKNSVATYFLKMDELKGKAQLLDLDSIKNLSERMLNGLKTIKQNLQDQETAMREGLKNSLKEKNTQLLSDVEGLQKKLTQKQRSLKSNVTDTKDSLAKLETKLKGILKLTGAPNNLYTEEKLLVVFLRDLLAKGSGADNDTALRKSASDIGITIGYYIKPGELLAREDVKLKIANLIVKAEQENKFYLQKSGVKEEKVKISENTGADRMVRALEESFKKKKEVQDKINQPSEEELKLYDTMETKTLQSIKDQYSITFPGFPTSITPESLRTFHTTLLSQNPTKAQSLLSKTSEILSINKILQKREDQRLAEEQAAPLVLQAQAWGDLSQALTSLEEVRRDFDILENSKEEASLLQKEISDIEKSVSAKRADIAKLGKAINEPNQEKTLEALSIVI